MLNRFKFTSKARQKINDYEAVFGTDAGERVLEDLMREFHVRDTTFHPEATVHAHSEGERNVVLYILSMLDRANPDYWKRVKDMPSVSPDYEEEDE